jgi:uncharacterized membrane protein
VARRDEPPQGPEGEGLGGGPPAPQSSLEDAPPGQITAIQLQRQQQQFTGPLPHPDILQGYEDVLPGVAERIVAMAERQAKHRQDIEQTIVEGGSRRASTGMWLGFVITILFLLVSAGLILAGHTVEGTILGSVDLVALATVFVVGRAEQRQEREEKAKYVQ